MAAHPNPLDFFAEWFEEAKQTEPRVPDAMQIATIAPDGRPTLRTVLLKDFDAAGFVFYTNLGSRKAREKLTSLGESLGFTFDYHDDMRMVNTFKAHQLIHWAGIKGKQTEVELALFAAFFSNRQDVSDVEVLANVARGVGLPAGEARELIEDGRFVDIVRREEQQWNDRDVYAVPTFFFNNKFQVPGAQEAETFLRVLNKIAASEAA